MDDFHKALTVTQKDKMEVLALEIKTADLRSHQMGLIANQTSRKGSRPAGRVQTGATPRREAEGGRCGEGPGRRAEDARVSRARGYSPRGDAK